MENQEVNLSECGTSDLVMELLYRDGVEVVYSTDGDDIFINVSGNAKYNIKFSGRGTLIFVPI